MRPTLIALAVEAQAQALAESQRMCLAQARDLDVERTLRRHDNEALEVAQHERDFIRSALAAAQQELGEMQLDAE